MQQASNSARNDNREEENESIEYQNLNENQKKIFNRIETHYNNILTHNQVELLRILVIGTAGTGKSYLIKAIREHLHRMAGADRNLRHLLWHPQESQHLISTDQQYIQRCLYQLLATKAST